MACFAGDEVDGALEVGVGGRAALDRDEVVVFLVFFFFCKIGFGF